MKFFAVLLKSVVVSWIAILWPTCIVKRADINSFTYKANKERYNDNWVFLRTVCMHRMGTEKMEEQKSDLLKAFSNANRNSTVEIFRRVPLECLHIVEHLAKVCTLVYDFEVSDKGNAGNLAQRFLRRFKSTTISMPFNDKICYATAVNKVFGAFCCPSCDKFCIKCRNLPRHLNKREELRRKIHPKTVYQLGETLLDRLRTFETEIADDKTFLKNFAVYDLESFSVKDSSPIDTETINWVGKHEPISVSVISNLLD